MNWSVHRICILDPAVRRSKRQHPQCFFAHFVNLCRGWWPYTPILAPLTSTLSRSPADPGFLYESGGRGVRKTVPPPTPKKHPKQPLAILAILTVPSVALMMAIVAGGVAIRPKAEDLRSKTEDVTPKTDVMRPFHVLGFRPDRLDRLLAGLSPCLFANLPASEVRIVRVARPLVDPPSHPSAMLDAYRIGGGGGSGGEGAGGDLTFYALVPAPPPGKPK